MKKTLAIAAAAIMAATATAAAQSVRLGTEGAYPPWNFIDESGNLAGYEIDLGNAICAHAGLDCEWVQNDWDSIIPNLLAGNYDVIMAGMSITEERQETIDFSEDYYPPDAARFVAAPGGEFDFDALSGLRIGAQSNTIQSAYLEEALAADNTILQYATPDQSVADLIAGNIDLLLADGSFLTPVVGGSDGAIEFVGPELYIGGGVGGGFRKEDTELRATFDAALDALKADGTVDALIAEWYEEGPYYSE